MFLSNRLNKTIFILGPLLLSLGWLLLTINPGDTKSEFWLLAHLSLLLGTLCLLSGLVTIRGLLMGRINSVLVDLLLAVSMLGISFLIAQFAIDISAWAVSPTSTSMDKFFNTVQSEPLTRAAFYTAGPGIFFIGLLVFSILLLRYNKDLQSPATLLAMSPVIVVLAHLLNASLVSLLGYLLLLIGFSMITKKIKATW